MASDRTFVVVGGGLGGAKAVQALREQGFDGDVVLISGEPRLPYERPPLSKDYLAGKTPVEKFTVHPEEWYGEHAVDVRRGVRAEAVDRGGHQVRLSDGSSVRYDRLLLATGSQPKRLPLPGADAEGVHTLRELPDADALREAVRDGRRLVVIGGGWIGLEVAAVARGNGASVAVVEALELPLLRVLGPEMAAVFADLHRDHGVDLRLQASVAEIRTVGGHVTGVALGDGTVLPADAVLVAVGAAPDLDLARDAGLDVGDGVLVDAALRTSDPDIVAVGDIAAHDHPVLGTRVRVEHWATALKQPAAAAATMLGNDGTYRELPYFFTDQYDLGMEYVGHATVGGYAGVATRGDVAGREFVAFWLDAQSRVLAGMNVNVWDVTDPIKALINSRKPVDVNRLTDPGIPLTEV